MECVQIRRNVIVKTSSWDANEWYFQFGRACIERSEVLLKYLSKDRSEVYEVHIYIQFYNTMTDQVLVTISRNMNVHTRKGLTDEGDLQTSIKLVQSLLENVNFNKNLFFDVRNNTSETI